MKQRDAYFDNAKIILLIFVVFGHFIEPMVEKSSLMKILFLFIYSFHMPAFIFISGYFSSGVYKKGTIRKLMLRFLLPYVTVQMAFIFFTKLIKVGNYQYTLKTPAYIYWYLFAMFVWNIVILILSKMEERGKAKGVNIKIECILVISFVLGLLAGYCDSISWKYSLSRIVVFFPYFLLGYYFKKKGLKVKGIVKNKGIPIAVLVLGAYCAIRYQELSIKWVWCSVPYSKLQIAGVWAALSRLLLYGIQISMLFSVLLLIPSKRKKFTHFGSRTMGIYLLHGFVVKLLQSLGYYD